MVIGYVKQTASRKTEQSKLRWKDENQSSLNSRSFKELLVNKRLHLRRVILTKRERRMSTMSSFLTFFSSSAGIVFFFSFTDFHHLVIVFFFSFTDFHHLVMVLSQKLQVCFHPLCCIFSITFVRSFVHFNKCRHFFVVQTTLL